MTTMVYFDANGAEYCMSVQATRAVRRTTGIVALPAPGRHVAGILPGDPPLTVISPLGDGGAHVLIVEAADAVFGLLVDAVTGLHQVAETEISAPPDGQDQPFVSGIIRSGERLTLVTDARALAGQL